MKTTIQVEQDTLHELKKIRSYPKQSYNDLILELISMKSNMRNQYDEFLHKIQQQKMKELWDNKEDEDWNKI